MLIIIKPGAGRGQALGEGREGGWQKTQEYEQDLAVSPPSLHTFLRFALPVPTIPCSKGMRMEAVQSLTFTQLSILRAVCAFKAVLRQWQVRVVFDAALLPPGGYILLRHWGHLFLPIGTDTCLADRLLLDKG